MALRTDKDSRERVALSPRYRVLLHNDPVNTTTHVVDTLMRVVNSLTVTQAERIMWEAHRKGVALVIVCALEHAEFFREGLGSGGLTATIEPE